MSTIEIAHACICMMTCHHYFSVFSYFECIHFLRCDVCPEIFLYIFKKNIFFFLLFFFILSSVYDIDNQIYRERNNN